MTAQYRAVLAAQWKWSRLIVVLGTVGAFAIPLLSLQGAARPERGALQTPELLRAVQSWGSVYPLLAAAGGRVAVRRARPASADLAGPPAQASSGAASADSE